MPESLKLDRDIVLAAGISETGVPYVAATMQWEGQPYFTAFEIPKWIVLCMNDAAKRCRVQQGRRGED